MRNAYNNALQPAPQAATAYPIQAAPATAITLTSYGTFDQMLYVGDMLAKSAMVPKAFRGQPGSVLLALNMAQRLRLDPFMVMQNIYDVNGRPALSGQFAIALLNKSPKYRRIEYRYCNGHDYKDGMQVVGHRVDDPEDKCPDVGTAITPAMVQAEQWGMKWRTMPEQMYRYRAAAFFARAYCPEELMGMRMEDEIEDEQAAAQMRNVTPAAGLTPAAAEQPKLDAPATDAEKKQEPATRRKKAADPAPAQVEQAAVETPATGTQEAKGGQWQRLKGMLDSAKVGVAAFKKWAATHNVRTPEMGSSPDDWESFAAWAFSEPDFIADMQRELNIQNTLI